MLIRPGLVTLRECKPSTSFVRYEDVQESPGHFIATRGVHQLQLPPLFSIAKYLVTNELFIQFVTDGGYVDDELWSIRRSERSDFVTADGITMGPRSWPTADSWPEGKAKHPVSGVCFLEARAFIKWANRTATPDPGWTWGLPSEDLWEFAARGEAGLSYPWGEAFDASKCNTAETAIGETSEVTRFESGASPVGCVDMAGNLWEFVEATDMMSNCCALRGGSYKDTCYEARSCFRSINIWDRHRSPDFGFRIAQVTVPNPIRNDRGQSFNRSRLLQKGKLDSPMNNTTDAFPTVDDQRGSAWVNASDLRSMAESVGTPVFIYSEAQLLRNVRRIKHATTAAGLDNRVEFYIPFFPNSNPHILTCLQELGIGLMLQLRSEFELLRRFGFSKFIISTGHIPDEDVDFWAETGYPMFLSSLDEIRYCLRNRCRPSINVRFDSLSSGKPGIKYGELEILSQLLKDNGRELDCFELYCGSGNTVDNMISIAEQVFMIFKTYFSHARAINFAGGFGFDYQETDEDKKHFDWDRYMRQLKEKADRYNVPENVKFLFEPARDILGDIGALLLSVTRGIIKHPGANRVLTDGSRVLIPSAQYKERRHNVIFFDSNMIEIKSKYIPAALRGRGILRHDYVLPGEYLVPDCISAKDYLLILDVGAYCATQHMEFLNIPPAAEAMIDSSGSMFLITSRGDKFDKWRYLLPERKKLGECCVECSSPTT